jgi:hypothetical protein
MSKASMRAIRLYGQIWHDAHGDDTLRDVRTLERVDHLIKGGMIIQ